MCLHNCIFYYSYYPWKNVRLYVLSMEYTQFAEVPIIKKLTQENILPNKLYIIKYSQVSICIELVSHFKPADKNYWWVIFGWKKKLDQVCKIIFLIHRYFKILNFHVGHVAVGSTQVQSTKTQIVKGSYWDLLFKI